MSSSRSALSFSFLSHGREAYQESVRLRADILRKPLGLAFSPEEGEQEKHHLHVGGFWEGDLVATAILVPEGRALKMRQVAIKESFQHQGMGRELLAFCENYGRKEGFSTIYCHARKTAVQFYLKNKYTSEGKPFIEIALPHIKMKKIL